MTHPLPLFAAISIQTNSRCNLRCPFCFYGQYQDYNSDTIILSDLIRRLFEELRDLKFKGRVALYNMNEPLTDDRILEFLQLAKAYLPDATHFFSTNGLLLDQRLLDQLTDIVDHLRINQYHELLPLDYSHPTIDLRNKRKFRQRATSNRGGSLTHLPVASRPGTGTCANPFGQLMIMPPGVAVLCCADGFKQVQIGNVAEESLPEIWYGPALDAIRQQLVSGKRSDLPLCKKCSVINGGFYEYFVNPAYFDQIIKLYRQSLFVNSDCTHDSEQERLT